MKTDLQIAIEALEEITQRDGQVCMDFGLCDHIGCHSSYEAFAIAQEALDLIRNGVKEEEEP